MNILNSIIIILFISFAVIAYGFKQKVNNYNENFYILDKELYSLKEDLHQHRNTLMKSLSTLQFNNDLLVSVFKKSTQQLNKYVDDHDRISIEYPKTHQLIHDYQQQYLQLVENTYLLMRLNAKVKNSLSYLHMQAKNSAGDYNTEYRIHLYEIISAFQEAKNHLSEVISPDQNKVSFFREHSRENEQMRLNYQHISLLFKNIARLNQNLLKINDSTIDKTLDKMYKSLLDETDQLKDRMMNLFAGLMLAILLILGVIIVLLIKNHNNQHRISQLQEDKNKKLSIDNLTGLFNRNKFRQDIKDQKDLSILLFDIVEFHQINETIGYTGGDNIIKQVSVFFKNLDLPCYRLGADQFLVISMDNNNDSNKSLALKIISDIENHRFAYKDLEIPIHLHCGLTQIKPYLKNAELALKKGYHCFDKVFIYTDKDDDSSSSAKNIDMLKQVKQAIEEDNIRPFFQPIVDIKTKEIVKYEALIRLIDKNGKVISPFFFLDITKRSGMYPNLTKIMLTKSIEFIEKMQIPVSINLSFQDILHNDTINFISLLLQMNHELCDKITFEIVETDEISSYQSFYHFAKLVKQYGCQIAIDDFGSGYSNYGNIFQLSPDIIKIDGSLIKNITEDKNSRNIVESIVSMAKKSDIKIIAEFIENEEIHQIMQEIGIDMGQGYYYSAPTDLLKGV